MILAARMLSPAEAVAGHAPLPPHQAPVLEAAAAAAAVPLADSLAWV